MSTTFKGSDIPVISPTFRLQWEEAQGCHVILYPEGMVKLNQAAGEILKRCDGVADVDAIIEDLTQQFPDADLKDDVYNFLDTAHGNNWIQRKSS